MLSRHTYPSVWTYGLIGLLTLLVVIIPAQAAAQDSTDDDVVSPQAVEIVGGEPATPGEWPWQAQVNAGIGLCGGSLIHPRWVLTAAHCLVGPTGSYLPPTAVTVVLGEHNRDIAEGAEQTRTVAQVVVHPGYRNSILYPGASDDNDIALLKLNLPVELNARASLVPLANSPADDPLVQPDTLATVTGWGRTVGIDPASTSDVLREVVLPVVSSAVCSAAYSPGSVTDNMVCAGYLEGGKDSCQGDSGGPLVVPDGNGGWKQLGIVSFGTGCAQPGKYGVYTRVSRYTAWIQQYINSPTGPAPVRNANFDAGSNGDWIEFSLAAPSSNLIVNTGLPLTPRSGTYVAWLGGLPLESSLLLQYIALSERATTLSFYYQIASTEDDCFSDISEVVVNSVPIAPRALCPLYQTSGWTLGTVDISGYAGQTVQLVFRALTDGDLNSNWFLDDISIETSAVPPLTVTDFTPKSGRLGTIISVSGSNFLDVAEVRFGGIAAPFAVQSDGVMNVTVPAGAGNGPLTVKTTYSTTTSASAFTVLHPVVAGIVGNGSGSVASAPVGILCGADCTEDFAAATVLTLTAQAAANSTFGGWNGACSGNQAICNLTVDAAKTVTATFTLNTFGLSVNKIGNGDGTVSSSLPGVDCGTDCTEIYTIGTAVTLTAQPATNSTFDGWGGECTGNQATCNLTVDAAKTVTAAFALKTFGLNVNKIGNGDGTVSSSLPGVDCGTDCAETYTIGTGVMLTAQAATNSIFSGWSGACTGNEAACNLTIDAAKQVTATFAPKTFAFIVTKEGDGSGSVTSEPSGIACGTDCEEVFTIGTPITLTAKPSDDSIFAGWGGACSGDVPVCTAIADTAKSVTATFERQSKALLLPVVIR